MPLERNPDVPRPAYSNWATPMRVHSNEEMENAEELFLDKKVRQCFIFRILLILGILYNITIGIICAFHFSPIHPWLKENVWYWYTILPLFMIMGIILACCGRFRYRKPWSYLFLIYVTLLLSCILGGASCYVDKWTMITAVGVIQICSVGLILMAAIPQTNFHICINFFIAAMVTISYLILAISISQHDRMLNIIISGVTAFAFIILLVIDAHLILRGKHYYPILPKEYILGATHLYIDVFFILIVIVNISRA